MRFSTRESCQPRMGLYLVQSQSLHLLHEKAAAQQTTTIKRKFSGKLHPGCDDLVVILPGDVTHHHVVEEDTEGPDSQGLPLISARANPLWRTVDSSAVIFLEIFFLGEAGRSKVYESELKIVQVHHEVLIFNVSVNNPGITAGDHCVNNLLEKQSSNFLLQASVVSDVVEQIHVLGRLLHHVDKGIFSLVEIQQFD